MKDAMVVVARPSVSGRHAPQRTGGGGGGGLLLGGEPYDPKRKRRRGGVGALLQKIAPLVGVCLLIWTVLRRRGGGGSEGNPDGASQRPPTRATTARRRALSQKAESLSQQLDKLSDALPLSTSESDESESKFLAAVRKECLPGRDDVGGEINPTTRRRKECLRHVPLGKGAGDAHQLEGLLERQRPRIGVMVPPGFLGRTFGAWISAALQDSSKRVGMDVDVVVTSHVPIYGYGKSHGFTKLIRFVSLPLSLAVYDAYLLAAAGEVDINSYYGDALKDALDEMKLGRKLTPPSVGSIGTIARLKMRWHCRLSHVSAHTAMLTLSLWDVVKDPTDALTSVLSYVWKENWDWEGQGGGTNKHNKQHPPPSGGWRREAEDLVGIDRGGHLDGLLDRTSTLLQETTPSLRGDDDAFKKAMQGAFAAEMKRSNDLTAWPCPSFWEGVDASEGATGEEGGFDQAGALRRIASEMVPDCGDDHPFARCTIKRDKCEVARDAQCR